MMGLMKFVVCACAFVQLASGAAIPMWEYLSKDEKMSYLYSMFATQVEEYCEKSNIPNCSQELLKYGLIKLKQIPEDHLDTMDPYQRGANNIIWESMMTGHEMMRTTQKPTRNSPTTTAKPNSYEDQSFGEDFLYNGEASARIESNYKLLPPKNFIVQDAPHTQRNTVAEVPYRTVFTGVPEYRFPPHKTVIYSEQQPQQPQQPEPQNIGYDVISFRNEYKKAPLDGPMVVRVHPDGTPVDEKIVVEDEDLKHFKLLQKGLPTFH